MPSTPAVLVESSNAVPHQPSSSTANGALPIGQSGDLDGQALANGVQEVIEQSSTDHDSNGHSDTQAYAQQVQAKYQAERDKRMRPEFDSQFVKLHTSEKYKHFTDDPWLPEDGSVRGIRLRENESPHFKFVVKGAGLGGLLYAARLVEQGYNPEDFAFIDYAGGFGGTWYWNRYPGLMCDIASEVYLPLLEETGYMPKHKYSYGQEIREHAERIAERYGFGNRGILRATVGAISWNDDSSLWEISVSQEQGPRQGADANKVLAQVTGDYVISMSGILNYPKLPVLQGLDDFQGHQFHTSRWDYTYTGGSQEQPDMINLKDKSVGIVGTGATAIQTFPQIAKWAKQVYLFQRTPSSVDIRDQRPTDPIEFKRASSKPGWQRERMDNLAAFMMNDPNKPDVNVVDDGWSRNPSYRALIGGPNNIDPTEPETIAEYIKSLHADDFARQERIRSRVDDIVKDSDTAQRLKAWYPGWCKRPCFHDDYLPAFNQPNVQLVDTEGRGIDRMRRNGAVVAGKEYPVDVLIWGTGYVVSSGSPSDKGSMTVRGRHGKLMSQKWEDGVATLHGVVTRDFPNFFFPFTQCGVTGNNTHNYQATSDHTAYLIAEAERQHPGKKVLIEPTHEAEEAWAMRVVGNAAAFAGVEGCTPGYINAEGKADKIREAPLEVQMKAARASPWGQGILDYQRITTEWRESGSFEGVDVTVL